MSEKEQVYDMIGNVSLVAVGLILLIMLIAYIVSDPE